MNMCSEGRSDKEARRYRRQWYGSEVNGQLPTTTKIGARAVYKHKMKF
jgi:hypothetical protein